MLTNFYFRHNGYDFAPITAKSESEARTALIVKHFWCKAPYESELYQILPLLSNSIYLQPSNKLSIATNMP